MRKLVNSDNPIKSRRDLAYALDGCADRLRREAEKIEKNMRMNAGTGGNP